VKPASAIAHFSSQRRETMMRWTMPAALLLLAACSSGEDKSQPDDTAATGSLQETERADPAATTIDADMPEAAEESAVKPEPPTATDGKTIPTAIRGRWALKSADCAAKKGTDLTALTIDATNLRFYESHGELARVHISEPGRIDADYQFSGEGATWDRRMQLDLADGGKTLVRRDQGEGAAAGPMRYTRCT
jgi:hypothetical protein